jgi:hypothetical protein
VNALVKNVHKNIVKKHELYTKSVRIYWILRSLRPHAAHTSFEVRRRLVLSLILPHVNYGNIVFTGADSASQRRLGIARLVCVTYI